MVLSSSFWGNDEDNDFKGGGGGNEEAMSFDDAFDILFFRISCFFWREKFGFFVNKLLPLLCHGPLSFQDGRRPALENQRAGSPGVIYDVESLLYEKESDAPLAVFVLFAVRVDV